jgi:hypothetical protein
VSRSSGTRARSRCTSTTFTRRAELEAKGVESHGEKIDSGVCFQAHFADPDGNALVLHHRYAPKR